MQQSPGLTNKWQGFWSYVHSDDDAEGGRIRQLARDVSKQFEMMSGESISLFLDRDTIEWGDNWRESVDTGLGSVAFFIAVITPRYFMSAECRRELQFFARKSDQLGMKELVLPLYYLDVPELEDDESSEPLISLIRAFQWEDWRDLRFADRDSEPYRRGVARLAKRLIDANRKQPTSENKATLEMPLVPEDTTEPPGLIDLLARTEDALPESTTTLGVISAEIEIIGQLMTQGAEDIRKGNAHGKAYAARLVVARRMASQLAEPVKRIEAAANAFASQLHDVDQGFRIIVDTAPSAVETASTSKKDVCEFFNSVKSMSRSAHCAFASVREMVEEIEPIERMSRDLRPPLRRLRQALTVLLESTEVIDEWVLLIDASPIECGNLLDETRA